MALGGASGNPGGSVLATLTFCHPYTIPPWSQVYTTVADGWVPGAGPQSAFPLSPSGSVASSGVSAT